MIAAATIVGKPLSAAALREAGPPFTTLADD